MILKGRCLFYLMISEIISLILMGNFLGFWYSLIEVLLTFILGIYLIKISLYLTYVKTINVIVFQKVIKKFSFKLLFDKEVTNDPGIMAVILAFCGILLILPGIISDIIALSVLIITFINNKISFTKFKKFKQKKQESEIYRNYDDSITISVKAEKTEEKAD